MISRAVSEMEPGRSLRRLPELLRASLGTAAVLGLERLWLDVKPTTAYLMTYSEGRCTANCSFCPQARGSTSSLRLLSRIIWPTYRTEDVLRGLLGSNGLRRACLQVINHPGFPEEVLSLVSALRGASLPISLDTPPLEEGDLRELEDMGLDRVCIPIDAATPELFERVKGRGVGGPYTWSLHMRGLMEALRIFGGGRVTTHLIIGLGETEREAASLIQEMWDMGVTTALFAFTPIPGTRLEGYPQPPLASYRRIQVARYLIARGLAHYEEMEFDEGGRLLSFGLEPSRLRESLSDGLAFQTSGCPGCNRPYYNERPGGPIYNYPRPLSKGEIDKELKRLEVT